MQATFAKLEVAKRPSPKLNYQRLAYSSKFAKLKLQAAGYKTWFETFIMQTQFDKLLS